MPNNNNPEYSDYQDPDTLADAYVMLDTTGQALVTALQAIKTALESHDFNFARRFNGISAVNQNIVATGADIPVSASDSTSIADKIAAIEARLNS